MPSKKASSAAVRRMKPSMAPSMVDNLRITLGWCWTYLIVAEIVARMPEREFLIAGAYSQEPADNLVCWGHIQDMRRFYREIDRLEDELRT